jgi:hypothetical protein
MSEVKQVLISFTLKQIRYLGKTMADDIILNKKSGNKARMDIATEIFLRLSKVYEEHK